MRGEAAVAKSFCEFFENLNMHPRAQRTEGPLSSKELKKTKVDKTNVEEQGTLSGLAK